MFNVYSPVLDHIYAAWPEGVKRELRIHLHKFLASLTETAFHAKGCTVLYIPNEDVSCMERAVTNKELVQMLETTLLHWTKQIKEVITNQENIELAENSGPLAEIEFWNSRTADLSSIRDQLNNPQVQLITQVLQAAKSSYVDPFLRLSNLIQQGSAEAHDNLKFLSLLLAPCEVLATAVPAEIPNALPKIIHCIRFIWSHSTSYKTPERILGLLTKVSNEIINRCRACINLQEIFDGDTDASTLLLQDSIKAGEGWKSLFVKTRDSMKTAGLGEQPWDFEETSIFAYLDAFIKRCCDLIEICEGQIQFARKNGSATEKLPAFGGSVGPEITKRLTEIEIAFLKQIQQIKELPYDILDVKTTRWHDDFNTFFKTIKELEVMMQNVIATAFETVSTVSTGVSLLEVFRHLAKSDAIVRTVEKRAADMYTKFLEDLTRVKEEFEQGRKVPPFTKTHPPFSGAAIWASTLLKRIMSQWLLFPPDWTVGDTRDDAYAQYQQLSAALQDYITKMHAAWVASITPEIAQQLDSSIMVRDANGFLASNFSKDILMLFSETYYWRQLHFFIPETAAQLYGQRETMNMMLENVLLVVRDYNHVLRNLSPEEKSLFSERVSEVDHKLSHALSKHTWQNTESVEPYLKKTRTQALSLMKIVSDFKHSCSRVTSDIATISSMKLTHIRRKTCYKTQDFEERQMANRAKARAALTKLHGEISDTLKKNAQVFQNDSADIQKEWFDFVTKTDSEIQAALLQAVKQSLQDLHDAVVEPENNKAEMPTFLQINATLLDVQGITFSPTLAQIAEMIGKVSREVVQCTAAVPRLSDTLLPPTSPDKRDQPFSQLIETETEVANIFKSIDTGMQSLLPKMEAYLNENSRLYSHIWEKDKDMFMKTYMNPPRPLAQFEADILSYQEMVAQIERAETITNVGFIRVDCSPLKYALVSHCNTWINKFTDLLHQLAEKELGDLHALFEDAIQKLKQSPRNLDQLKQAIELLKKLQDDSPAIEQRFEPLEAQYRALKRFEVVIDAAEQTSRESLPTAWATFRQTLLDADQTLKHKKERFKSDLVKQMKDFAQAVTNFHQDLTSKGPFAANIPSEKAFKMIKDIRSHYDQLLERESKLRSGLELFNMDAPPNKELIGILKEVETLEKVWLLSEEWNKAWENWRTIAFTELDVQSMEAEALKFQDRAVKLSREAKGWGILVNIRERIDQFKGGLPLIQDLKNPALRPRHWDKLQEEVGKTFRPDDPDFTLDQVFAIGLDGYVDVIANISVSASKELAIEESLKEIEAKWTELKLDLVPHKDTGQFLLHSCDEIFQVLEDHKVILADMKASRYFYAFEAQVEYWERSLSHILETLELMLKVQRLWRYLESIFVGSEDIRRQLPAESAVFDKVNSSWKQTMERLSRSPNVLKCANTEGLLEMLNDMNTKLEKIQSYLYQYLENKRKNFPRFYFLSDHDLLEVLGQARDPLTIQKHLHNCFDNLNQLGFNLPGKERKKHEAFKMISAEGEEVTFLQPVVCDGPVESWMTLVEEQMIESLNKQIYTAVVGFTIFKKEKPSNQEKFLKKTPGQLVILSSQIAWTTSCQKALASIENGTDKSAMRELRKRQGATLRKLSEMVRGQLTPLSRLKLVALLTIEIHQRDIIERLIKNNVASDKDFEWKSQLRFYWDKDEEECYVRQVDFEFHYGNEYLGNTGRLVVTPLTDKVYMALTTALMLKKGGNPQGPAGTGKTETVKDLGKALAKFVLVNNCSDKQDVISMGRSLAGLAQTGQWSCFDEFNRITPKVLSVVATQIASILNAVAAGKRKFVFQTGAEITLKPGVGIFVTMNPTYAGRSELPDNLKSQFRPVAMMVPDSSMIAEIILFSEGFSATKNLSRKLVTLYQLCKEQLSQQDHYDFTLRSIKSVLVTAGAIKRRDQQMPEEIVLLKSLRDMNLPKFVGEDIALFNAILSDIFRGVEIADNTATVLQLAVNAELQEQCLQPHTELVRKTIQLYDTKLTRHSTMVVGKTGSGKTTCWRTLQGALTRLKKQKDPFSKDLKDLSAFNVVKVTVVNPKALTVDELYGYYDSKTHEWSDGIVSTIMRNCSADPKPDEKWIVFDGPVDTLWIESMNSVMDDNKVLTPVNGERIYLSQQVSLVFEVEDLSKASPATVSRCGMIYMEADVLGWKPYVESWIARRPDPETHELLRGLFNKFVPPLLDFKARDCQELVPVTKMNSIISLCNLFDALATPENGVTPQDADFYHRMIELWFLFSLIWSVGASVTEESRKRVDMFLREIEGQFPRKDTVYEYFVDPVKKGWALWEEKLTSGWRPPTDVPFHKILVPTVDTLRNSFLLTTLIKSNKNTLLVGNTGTGKTATVQSVLNGPLHESYNTMTINFSAQTSAHKLQEFIQTYVDKRTQFVFFPRGGKKLIAFIDDLNMPEKDAFGSQPPLELLRQWIDYGFWYDRATASPNNIKDMQLVCCMGPPGGGRSVISPRLQSRFNLINITFPVDVQIKRIFGTLINHKLLDFEEEIKPLGDLMTQATWEIYQQVSSTLLPTPTRSHYVFNLRDMSKVFQGLLCANHDFFDSADSMVKLWTHENLRVFHDRLVDDIDRQWFLNLIQEKLVTTFGVSWVKLFKDHRSAPIFASFVTAEEPVYQEHDLDTLRKALEQSLEEYNVHSQMDLVMFKDAIEHVCRIHRIITQPRGNALLVGLGGSGRQSLARLASFIASLKVFTVDVRKGFREVDFREKIKELYALTGQEEKPTVFVFSDTQVLRQGFLEDVSNMLSSGEIPNLYSTDELHVIRDNMRASLESKGAAGLKLVPRMDPDSLYQHFIDRARSNMHIIFLMSPVGKFRDYCRMFPALVNCTSIDWFSEWPQDALKEVAMKFLNSMPTIAEYSEQISVICFKMHTLAIDISRKMLLELKRENYVTPTNYLEMLRGFASIIEEKELQLGGAAEKLESGLNKLDESRVKVEELSESQKEMQKKVSKLQKECDEALVNIVQQKQEASDQARDIEIQETKLKKEEQNIKEETEKAKAELNNVMPAFEAAKKALTALDRRDLGEIRTYLTPLPQVEKVMEAVMVLRHTNDTSWAEAKRQLADPTFIQQLMNYNIETVSDAMLRRIDKYCADPEFRPEKVQRVSVALMSLCQWVHAVKQCSHAYRDVAPKQLAVKGLVEEMEKNESALKEAQENLKHINEKLEVLRADHASKVGDKDKLAAEAKEAEVKINRANRLITGLASEKIRWQISIAKYKDEREKLPGDCLVAAAFLAYAGPFSYEYRQEFLLTHPHSLTNLVKESKIPHSGEFNFANFLAEKVKVREWAIQGLPNDPFSTENGVLVTRGKRWPLIIDPEGQANQWIKNMEKKNNLRIVTPNQDFMHTIENALHFGMPVLMEDVHEDLDPSLEPILTKKLIKRGSRTLIVLDEGKEIDYNDDFRFYMTTKLPLPRYPPEVTTKTTVVNFTVREQGLQQQLLGQVVQHERAELEEQKNSLVVNIAQAQKTLLTLEEDILKLLNTAQGSLLDDENLVNALESAKKTAEDIKQQLEIAEQNEIKIDSARQAFVPCAVRASTLFFVLKELSVVDIMYQYSLDMYTSLFRQSLAHSPASEELQERIRSLNDYHTTHIYRSTCRGLFEKHKILFSLQLCVKIMESEKRINKEEYQFFLRGGQVLSKENQMSNPCAEWLPDAVWDHVSVLDRMHSFRNIGTSLEQNQKEWREWFFRPEPENVPLPGEWENKCNELQHLIIVRCFRPDRIISAITAFISGNLDPKYIDPPAFDPRQTFEDSTNRIPLIFILSPGVDPVDRVITLAQAMGMYENFSYHALGQGQEAKAKSLIEEGMNDGKWVFLANCHLMIDWMPELEKTMEEMPMRTVHENFRLWLSSSPHPQFPISILQQSIKITTQPPKGIKLNLLRLYNSISEAMFTRCKSPQRYKKLLFALCYLHGVLLERRKFLSLGWNSAYDFNDSDFLVSEHLLTIFLDEYENETPWTALRYIIAELNYGGRVTDHWDMHTISVYIRRFFSPDALSTANFRLSGLPTYYIPEDGSLQSYKDYIGTLPINDKPEAFGQHSNADVNSQIQDSTALLNSLLSLQPRVITGVGESREQKLLTLIADLQERQIPQDNIDVTTVRKLKREDPTNPLLTVLMHEIERYNELLVKIRLSLAELKKGLKGLAVMSSELDEMASCLFDSRVPTLWMGVYPSLRPLASWVFDLRQRIEMFSSWAQDKQPKVFWLGGFTFPTGFLTAILQRAARKNNVSIDTLTWEFTPMKEQEQEITAEPAEGAYIRGLILEGASWDVVVQSLKEPAPLELDCQMPIMYFKPVDVKRKAQQAATPLPAAAPTATQGGSQQQTGPTVPLIYSCPCYFYPVREGSREKPSYILTVDLLSGKEKPEHWTLRGTALLLTK
eukprot:TRINITY_DN122_c1_g4_i2.p1 TRINITY_DN122_c1_g4~~TRINITY_DN122_c1_g4_i2.p1  ORF type:complete len:4382 (+),score=1298.66 TRINITY_DN122_c1_g4_i2:875-14020(+)